MPDVLAAAAVGEPAPRCGSLDAHESLTAALEQARRLLHDHRAVILRAALDQEDLPQLLRDVDRAVAIVANRDEARAVAGARARRTA